MAGCSDLALLAEYHYVSLTRDEADGTDNAQILPTELVQSISNHPWLDLCLTLRNLGSMAIWTFLPTYLVWMPS